MKIIIELINSVQLPYTTEDRLQSQLHELFKSNGIEVVREFRISIQNRVDFMAKHEGRNIAIECKIKGSATSVMAQLARYAESVQVDDVILVTSRRNHLASEVFREGVILGKPLAGIWIGGMR